MPKLFWNDKNNKKYKKVYFSKYKNIWHHGDYAERKKWWLCNLWKIDATLNPAGLDLELQKFIRLLKNLKI